MQRHALPYVITVAVLAALVAWHFVGPSRGTTYKTAPVSRGDLVAESLASGNVESPTTAELHFTASGKLVALPVRIGQAVNAGSILARQDTSILEAQLAQALSQVAVQQAQLDTLLEGTRPEQLAVTEAQVAADQVSVDRTKAAETDALQSAYTTADSILRNTLDPLFSNPHGINPQLVFFVNDTTLKNTIESGRVVIGTTIGALGRTVAVMSVTDPAAAEQDTIQGLASVGTLLAQMGSALSLSTANSQASVTQLSTWSAAVATARASVSAAMTSLTAAITAREAAEAQLAKDQKTFELQKAGATQSSVAAQQAAVASAQAQAASIRAQIRNLEITAPFPGIVTDTNGTVGENITQAVTVVALQPYEKLDIKANVSEDSIVGVKVGDHVRIELDAFPDGTDFSGIVQSINPAETLDGGAIYYETHIGFDQAYDGLRPGMTANVWIETASSTDALAVPASALVRSATSTTVRVLQGGVPQTRIVTTGIQAQDGRVEIRSGLTEGEIVIIGQ